MENTHLFEITEGEAVKIGRRTGIAFGGLGVLVANILVTIFVSVSDGISNGLVWFLHFEYWPSLLVGIAAIIVFSYFLCGSAAAAVITGKKNEVWVGSATAVAVLFASGVSAGLFLVFQNMFSAPPSGSIVLTDLVILPALILTFYGFLPASILGICFGVFIRKKATTREVKATHEVAAA